MSQSRRQKVASSISIQHRSLGTLHAVQHHSITQPDSTPFSFLMSFAGTPPTRQCSSTSFATTAPAAIVHPRPIVMPGRMRAPAPIQQSMIYFSHCLIGTEYGVMWGSKTRRTPTVPDRDRLSKRTGIAVLSDRRINLMRISTDPVFRNQHYLF